MPVAIVAAGIGAVGAIGGAVIASSASHHAADVAAQSAAANNSLASSQFATNSANMSPAIARGNAAGGYVQDLLGIGGDPAAAAKAFDTYKGSTGYQFQLNQGLGAVNSNAYARGMGDSGATLKALQQRGNDVAAQSFNSYLGNLQDISRQGTTAASSLAGVSTNYVGQVAANNNNAADAAGSAALSSGANWASALRNIGNSAAYAYGSSYGAKTQPPPPYNPINYLASAR
jgi:hypothetical protein